MAWGSMGSVQFYITVMNGCWIDVFVICGSDAFELIFTELVRNGSEAEPRQGQGPPERMRGKA